MDYPADHKNIEMYSAVTLFAQRARQVRHDFSLNDELRAFAEICRLVEGMPLAIELAAGWLKRLTCDAIADEIERNLDFLTTNFRGVPDRHRSIRAVFAHSWRLLSDDEKSVFMKLSVFRGGCAREAAEKVSGASLFVLSELLDKSLLRLNADGRYDIQELLRQFAEEKLEEEPDILEQTLDKHCEYYMDFVTSRESDRISVIEQTMRQEDENILQAWAYAVDRHKRDSIQNALGFLAPHYELRMKAQLFYRTVQALQTNNPQGEQGIAFGFALSAYGAALRLEGKYEQAVQRLREGINILDRLHAQSELIWAKNLLTMTLFMMDEFQQSREVIHEVIKLGETIEDYGSMAQALTNLGVIERMAGRYHEAQRLIIMSADLFRQNGNWTVYHHRMGYLAEIVQLMENTNKRNK
jgi:tetratricopeptide (TPR) repeat protein